MDEATHQNLVRKLRRWNELSQQELADAVGVSRQTIANIEKGNYSPSVHLALDICRVFKKTVEEVFAPETNEGA
ncbi:helix-turn-helix transcriptional regulator [Corynebacterium epidermidicanis]|uniref:Putative transcriptional regulator n=1 Tax=Corynebacterium epidermidicanis TaxID=1050174 RepID=A0A0G3GTE7_9CORY|nr:helix-turn-helix transcriptional regulator [Corynebacterium epidermidicanis]AKK02813.1 putative transcriptional regulator [Corynebacterium epidermidicanis]